MEVESGDPNPEHLTVVSGSCAINNECLGDHLDLGLGWPVHVRLEASTWLLYFAVERRALASDARRQFELTTPR